MYIKNKILEKLWWVWLFLTLRKVCIECWGSGAKWKHNQKGPCPLCPGTGWRYSNGMQIIWFFHIKYYIQQPAEYYCTRRYAVYRKFMFWNKRIELFPSWELAIIKLHQLQEKAIKI